MSRTVGAILSAAPRYAKGRETPVCLGCHFTGYPDQRGRCPRCISRYAYVAVIVCKNAGRRCCVNRFVVTCQPVAYLYHLSEGGRQEDTILSGIMSLASSNMQLRESCLSPVFWYRLLK